MRYHRIVLAALFATATFAVSGSPLCAAYAGALIPIQGTVVRVDPTHGRLTLRHAPLETAPGGVRICLVPNRKELTGLKAGARISALADTSRREWRLRRIRLQF
jgi:hypothetical protein